MTGHNDNSRMPKVSICVTTYNQQQYILDCVSSVLAQSDDVAIELLVGDDASTDMTSQLLMEIASRHSGIMRVIRHEQNVGAVRNLQSLIEQARGEYIAHLDGDDFWLPGKLKSQSKFLDDHPECAAVYTNAIVLSDKRELYGPFNDSLPETFDKDFLLRRGNFLCHSSILYRQELKHEILNVSSDLIDYRIHLCLARHGRLGYINQAMLVYRLHSQTSMVKNKPGKVQYLTWEAITLSGRASASEGAYRDAIVQFLVPIMSNALRHGRFQDAMVWLARGREQLSDGSKFLLARLVLRGLASKGRRIIRALGARLIGSRLQTLHRR